MRVLVPVLAALALGACSLLSTPDPVQLYRFGGGAAPPGPARVEAPIEITLRTIEFDQATRGERILGVTGTEAAYIKGARWVAPAQSLFTDGLESAFAAGASRVRVIGRREITPGVQTLDVDVSTFEVRYPSAGAAPTVRVVARARLLNRDRSIATDQTFAAERPAGANRVGAIVEAFDAAAAEVTEQIVAWTDLNARAE